MKSLIIIAWSLLVTCSSSLPIRTQSINIPPTVAAYQFRHGDLRYHGGPVMSRSIGHVVFWQPPGTHFELSADGDSRYRRLVQRYLRDVGETPFYQLLAQYSYVPLGTNAPKPSAHVALAQSGPITDISTTMGTFTDTTPFPRSATISNPLLYTDMAAPVRRAIAARHWKTGTSQIFYLFTAGSPASCYVGKTECIPTQGCATHVSYGPATHPTIVVIVPSLVHYATCAGSVAAYQAGGQLPPNGDPVADAAIDVLSHEQFEAVTDPVDGNSVTPVPTNGWYDSSPAFGEIGDKCQSMSPVGRPDVVLHGHRYSVQREWSNLDHRCVFRVPKR